MVNTKLKSLLSLLIIVFFGVFTPKTQADSYQIYLYQDPVTGEVRKDRFVSEEFTKVSEDDTLTIDERSKRNPDGKIQVILEAYQYTLSQILYYDVSPDDFSLLIPYLPHVKTIKVIPPIGQSFSFDVQTQSICNQNTICEYENGENENTCIADCIGNSVQYSSETESLLAENSGIIRDEQGTALINNQSTQSQNDTAVGTDEQSNGGSVILLVLGILFLGGGIGFFVWKSIRR